MTLGTHVYSVCSASFLFINVSFPQIEEEKQKKIEAVKEARAQKRKKEKEAASKEAEPGAKKARQVKGRSHPSRSCFSPF